MKPGNFILIILSLLSLTACLDTIDLDVPKGTEEGIVIRGELIKGDPSILRIRISNIFNFDLKSLGLVLLDAVTLIDEAGNEMEIEQRESTLFQHIFDPVADPIKIEHYQKYKIRVAVEDGRVYESSFEELLPLPAGETQLKYELSTRESLNDKGEILSKPAVQFLANTPIEMPNSDNNAQLLWTAERTYQLTDSALVNIPTVYSKVCYITVNVDFDNIHILDGNAFEGDEAINFPLSQVLINYEFAEGYTYTVYRKSLNPTAFRYWSRTKQSIERQGFLFEPVVGRVQSNFTNLNDDKDNSVFGYFTAHDQDTTHFYVPPVLGEERLCPLPPRRFSPECPTPFPVCCDCSQQPGSTTRKPDFWEG